MSHRSLLLGAAASLALCVVTGERWMATMLVNIDAPATGPGIVIVHSVPWLGWLCVIFLATTVGLVWTLLRRIRLSDYREHKGLCRSCDYDFRATPGRCPECGAVPDDKGKA